MTYIITGIVGYSVGMVITTLLFFAGFYWKDIVNEPEFGGNEGE